ncbi:hypothetical protein Y032_0003g1459 [Ancylostoma ceylanicum]|uniref:Uncharacterized protein n=1 Tax=Ancylostoma ceylanicum TaxID=53326 RepID=A0A016VXR6_9BILA|nr:hypothetical protein Y032_0003g1459 [Ancylostoma ceylanicum]
MLESLVIHFFVFPPRMILVHLVIPVYLRVYLLRAKVSPSTPGIEPRQPLRPMGEATKPRPRLRDTQHPRRTSMWRR